MTRGLRNNNPLNIRRNNTKWQGLSVTQTDKSFFQFKTMAYGYRAAFKTLQTYIFNKYDTDKDGTANENLLIVILSAAQSMSQTS